MKKLNLYTVEEKLLFLNLKIFTPYDLETIFKVKKRAVEAFLSYNRKKGIFLRLKNGLYALKRSLPHDFVLANHLYSPSYVSLDSALSYYNLLPETIYSITSLTIKPTREFTVSHRLFEYHKIKRGAYAGYLPQRINGGTVYLATPEKAVADFLYFVSLGKRAFNERLKLKSVNKKKLQEYLKLFAQEKLLIFLERFYSKL